MNSRSIKGLISAVQKGSVHDGPGIRTVVFLKGCNMRCAWCHNPETVYGKEETLFAPDKCIGCGECEKGCFSGAKVICGQYIEPEQIWKEIQEDRPYYGETGGVTISGGEPLCQSEFVMALLKLCKARGVHTALETNLSMPTEIVLKVCGLTDMIMCDFKIYDTDRHIAYTGISNAGIIKNLYEIDRLNIPILVRTPVISGINDEEGQIVKIAEHISKMKNLIGYELLTYHPLGLLKPQSRYFVPKKFTKPSKEKMLLLANLASAGGLEIFVDHVPIEKRGMQRVDL